MFLASGADIVGGFSDIGNGFKNRKPQPVATVPLVFFVSCCPVSEKDCRNGLLELLIGKVG